MAAADLTLTLEQGNARDQVTLPPARARLRPVTGAPVSVALGLAPINVGTSPDCQLVSSDPRVSRLHCRLWFGRDGIVVQDLGSKNGVYLGTTRIQEAVLTLGTAVQVGDSTLDIVLEGSPQVIPLSKTASFGEAVGSSLVMRALFADLAKVSLTDAGVLLIGESGTGKDLLARAIHEHGPRRSGPFVVFDCAAVSSELIEDELIGHAAGAFTGAHAERQGLLAEAHGGTLFIDEVGELPLEIQPRLFAGPGNQRGSTSRRQRRCSRGPPRDRGNTPRPQHLGGERHLPAGPVISTGRC